MRLIDADKLHYIRKLFEEDSDKSEVVVFAKEIDKAPTVKAIPIEWIEKWISERNDFPTMPYNQHIWNMLDDWEAERREE